MSFLTERTLKVPRFDVSYVLNNLLYRLGWRPVCTVPIQIAVDTPNSVPMGLEKRHHDRADESLMTSDEDFHENLPTESAHIPDEAEEISVVRSALLHWVATVAVFAAMDFCDSRLFDLPLQ